MDLPAPEAPAPSTPTDTVEVGLAMLYTLWGRASLLGQSTAAADIERLLLAAADTCSGAGSIDAALASIGPRDLPFERSPLDLAVAKLVASPPQRAEFRLLGLRGTDVAGYLAHQSRTEYIGSPWRHQVRHDRLPELLPPAKAMSAFQAVSRGSRRDHAFVTDFDLPSQLAVRIGTACSRFKVFDSRHYHYTRLTFHDDSGSVEPLDGPIPVNLVRRPGRAHALECVNDADLFRLHALQARATWVHLSTSGFALLGRLPDVEHDGDIRLARFHAHRTLLERTGIAHGHSIPVSAKLVREWFAVHRWFAPDSTQDWLALARGLETDIALSTEEPESWLIS